MARREGEEGDSWGNPLSHLSSECPQWLHNTSIGGDNATTVQKCHPRRDSHLHHHWRPRPISAVISPVPSRGKHRPTKALVPNHRASLLGFPFWGPWLEWYFLLSQPNLLGNNWWHFLPLPFFLLFLTVLISMRERQGRLAALHST